MKNNKLLSLSVLSVMVASTLASGAVFAQETTTPEKGTTTATTTKAAETEKKDETKTEAKADTSAKAETTSATNATVSTQKVTLNLTKEDATMHYKVGTVSSTDASGASTNQSEMVIKPNTTFQMGFENAPSSLVSHFETAGLKMAYMCPNSNDAVGTSWDEYKKTVETAVTDASEKDSCLKDFYVVYLGEAEAKVPAQTDFVATDTTLKSIGGFEEINGAFTPTTEFQIVTTNEELVEKTTVEPVAAEPKAEETKPVNTKETGIATNLLLVSIFLAALVGRKVMKNM